MWKLISTFLFLTGFSISFIILGIGAMFVFIAGFGQLLLSCICNRSKCKIYFKEEIIVIIPIISIYFFLVLILY
jgi:hypothetical protein